MTANKFFGLVVLAAAFMAFGLTEISGQKASKFFAPERVLLAGDVEEEDFESRTLIKELFYPIGWSRDGKFAFITEPADEACGCYYGEFYIVDLRSDKILWTKKISGRRIETGRHRHVLARQRKGIFQKTYRT